MGILEAVPEVIGRHLTAASVIGREFSLEQLKPLTDDTIEDRMLEVLEEALAARLVEELPRSVGRRPSPLS